MYVSVGNEEAKEGHGDFLVVLKYHFHHLSTFYKKPLVTFGCLEDSVQRQNQSRRSLYNQAFPHLLPNEYWSLLPRTSHLSIPLNDHCRTSFTSTLPFMSFSLPGESLLFQNSLGFCGSFVCFCQHWVYLKRRDTL